MTRVMTAPPPNIFAHSRNISVRRRAISRAALQGNKKGVARYIHNAIAEDIIERLSFMKFVPGNVLVIGDLGDVIASALRAYAPATAITAPEFVREDLPIDGAPYDVIINCSSLASINDVPGALLMMRAALSDNGIAIAALVGAGSLMKLRHICLDADGERPAARMHPMIDNRAAAGLMQRAGFRRQVVDDWPIHVRFSSLHMLVSDLRDMGLTNTLANVPPPFTKASHRRALIAFAEAADKDGKLAEKFEILTLTGWK